MTTMAYNELRQVVEADRSYASPGLRFGLYFDGWNPAVFTPVKTDKKEALKKACALQAAHKDLIHSLIERQRGIAESIQSRIAWRGTMFSLGPFVTGLGLEHPLENGFSFLSPYGVPYLPGSAVKGVVRRAAEELALFEPDPDGWSVTRVWWLFGFDENSAFFKKKEKDTPDVIAQELARWRSAYDAAISACDPVEIEAIIRLLPDSKDRDEWRSRGLEFLRELPENRELRRKLHLVGSLRFWDVYPEIAGGKLSVDIMNPHFNHYYQGDRPPGDWGSPNPIFFLTIPAGSSFQFVVERSETAGMPSSIHDFIGAGIEQVMLFSFKWMGFGAKTSLGYGLMGSESELPKSTAQPGKPANDTTPQVQKKEFSVPPQTHKPAHKGSYHQPTAEPQTSKPIVIQADSSLPDETQRLKAVLVTAVANGKARIKFENGDEMDASKFPPYPLTPAGRRCTVEVTTRGGKPIKAIFKGFI
ncbi:MAG: type III-B CRISPR module RAMP protein Cmr6 [Kiritimatiellae bacterium]|nr:type III-B CRISPR module RAMP protein Cmr6 [Kiritimatiellia bacterium]NLI46913.1 type III-B CRISPR module RAMP protein Cmr6 [Acidobacteriota bacterium]HPB28259.1 type III-B CRISPR module RAMP protein Cmr6 [Acidobacteriota bacterium]